MASLRAGLLCQRALVSLISRINSVITPRIALLQPHTALFGRKPQFNGLRLTHEDAGPPGSSHENVGSKKFRDFDLAGGVYIVTGGARGLGLCIAEVLVETSGKVYCLDRLPEPNDSFAEARRRVLPEFGSELHYAQIDVRDSKSLNGVIARIAEKYERPDGLIAGTSSIPPFNPQTTSLCPAQTPSPPAFLYGQVSYSPSASEPANSPQAWQLQPTHLAPLNTAAGIQKACLVANKGLISPVYNSSKAALIQLAHNLDMEQGRVWDGGGSGIRVNALSQGYIVTLMVLSNFEEVKGLREYWERESMLGRLASLEESKGAGLVLLSRASSFMTGGNLVIDRGHTAWYIGVWGVIRMGFWRKDCSRVERRR